jgi:hypothetical protein
MVDGGTTVSAPVSHGSSDWREEFKRLLAWQNRDFGSRGWGEILLIGDRLVVKEVHAGAEDRLRQALDQLVRSAHRKAAEVAASRDEAREDLKTALLTRERPRPF